MSDAVYEPILRIEEMEAAGGWTIERARASTIVAIAAGLMAIGAVMTFSASVGPEHAPVWWPLWKSPVVRQFMFVGAGLISMVIAMHIPYRLWSKGRGFFAIAFLVVSLVALSLVFVPHIGVRINNARRWVQFGPASMGIRFQPSELLKISLPVFLSVWITQVVNIRKFWRGLVPIMVIVGICAAAVGIEDFGTAALLAAVAGTMLLVAGARWWHLSMMVFPAVPVAGWLLMSRSHRMERLMIFRDIWHDPLRKGYQVIQSLCTIASGGWWGRGLGQGFVKSYLPEARTDFIFAVICEELGIIGAIAVMGLFVVLIWQGLMVVTRCNDPVGRLLAFGITFILGFQAAMNIAVVTVSVPTKGIALPLVSGGGSGVIFLGALVGILANIARTPTTEVRAPDARVERERRLVAAFLTEAEITPQA
jgi:cell division protein FtsW